MILVFFATICYQKRKKPRYANRESFPIASRAIYLFLSGEKFCGGEKERENTSVRSVANPKDSSL